MIRLLFSMIFGVVASVAQADDTCLPVKGPVLICDDENTWIVAEEIEDTIAMEAMIADGIHARVHVAIGTGIENHTFDYQYRIEEIETVTAERAANTSDYFFETSTTQMGGYPAYILRYPDERDGELGIRSHALLLLPRLAIEVSIFEIDGIVTPEGGAHIVGLLHISTLVELLDNIKFDWENQ